MSLFDRDQNGFVASEELKEAMCTLGEEPYSEKEWEDFLSEYEMTPDGQIDYELLIDLMTKKDAA